MGGFMSWSFPVFRIFGIQVRVHWFLALLVAIEVLRGLLDEGLVGMAWYGALMGSLFVCILIHELGHCWAARSVGGHAEQILLWPLGGLAYVGHGGAPRDDIKVAAAGPLTHIPVVAGCVAALLLLGKPWTWTLLSPFHDWYPYFPFDENFGTNLLVAVIKLQVVLFLLNLLVPAYPLDGGRILVNLLLIRYGRQQAALVTTYFSFPIGIALIVWGALQRDFLLAFIGVSVVFEGWQIRRLAQMGEIDAHPMFAAAPEFDYMPERPKRPGWFARWRRSRALKRLQREAEEAAALQARVDAVLDKVSREGLASLTPQERQILDEASRSMRGK